MKRLAIFLLLLLGPWAAAQTADSAQQLRRTPVVTAIGRAHGAVVNISTERTVAFRRGLGPSFGPGSDLFDRMFEDYFQGPVVERRRVQTPLGSGCIITPDGLVITNEHVIRRATNLKLSLDTGETFDAVLLAADPIGDIALLRAQRDKPLPAIVMGASNDLMLGETVIAMGNPFGFENSATAGIVSAFNREIDIGAGQERVHYTGLVQTSAQINPGNSGGPLINVLGELIGINTAVVEQAQGIGFAIPIDRARDLLAPLLAAGRISEAWSGIVGDTQPGRLGVRLTRIEPISPAAGSLRPDDLVTQIDDRPVGDLFDLEIILIQRKPGDTVALTVQRAERTLPVKLTLARLPQPSPVELLRDKLGVSGQDLDRALARQLGAAVETGMVLTDVVKGGPAERAGLLRGDVIIKIGSHPVRALPDAAAALRATLPGEWVNIVVVRQNYAANARIAVGK